MSVQYYSFKGKTVKLNMDRMVEIKTLENEYAQKKLTVADISEDDAGGGKLEFTSFFVNDLEAADFFSKSSDPYIVFGIRDRNTKTFTSQLKSEVRKKTTTGMFIINEGKQDVNLRNHDGILVEVWDWNRFSAHKLLGKAFLPLSKLTAGISKSAALPLLTEKDEPAQGDVTISYTLTCDALQKLKSAKQQELDEKIEKIIQAEHEEKERKEQELDQKLQEEKEKKYLATRQELMPTITTFNKEFAEALESTEKSGAFSIWAEQLTSEKMGFVLNEIKVYPSEKIASAIAAHISGSDDGFLHILGVYLISYNGVVPSSNQLIEWMSKSEFARKLDTVFLSQLIPALNHRMQLGKSFAELDAKYETLIKYYLPIFPYPTVARIFGLYWNPQVTRLSQVLEISFGTSLLDKCLLDLKSTKMFHKEEYKIALRLFLALVELTHNTYTLSDNRFVLKDCLFTTLYKDTADLLESLEKESSYEFRSVQPYVTNFVLILEQVHFYRSISLETRDRIISWYSANGVYYTGNKIFAEKANSKNSEVVPFLGGQ